MPVRDAAPWLDESLGSIRDQTDADWELLAVDDGSADASRSILDQHASSDSRVQVLSTSPDRRGIVEALNRGLGVARAPLLARMDADDLAHPARLAEQRRALELDEGLFATSCRVAAFGPEAVGEGMQRYLAWQNSLLTPGSIARDRFVESPVVHPSTMMRTGPLRDELGGWLERGWPEDWDLFLRAMERGMRIGRVDAELMRWRLHDAQATRSDERYGEDRLLSVRAHYLARELARVRSGRDVWILGSGPVGKMLCKALAREGMRCAALADVDPRKIGGVIRDGASRWPVRAMEDLFAATPRPYAVGAVGRPGGRNDIRGLMTSRGWRETDDYVVAA